MEKLKNEISALESGLRAAQKRSREARDALLRGEEEHNRLQAEITSLTLSKQVEKCSALSLSSELFPRNRILTRQGQDFAVADASALDNCSCVHVCSHHRQPAHLLKYRHKSALSTAAIVRCLMRR